MERAGASGIGGMPGAPHNILDAGAQEYYPAVGAAYPFPPLQHQQLYCPPPPYPAMLPPAPMPMAMPVPMPPPQTVPIPQQFGIPMPPAAVTAVVDGPPCRAVVLSLLPPHAPADEVKRAMELLGDVSAVDTRDLASGGMATVHFYDLRHAERAVAAVREQHIRQQYRLSQHFAATGTWPLQPPPTWDWQQDDNLGLVLGQVVWANFATSALPVDGANDGSLVVLNSLPDVSLSELRQAFQAYGDLKDVRESPHRSSSKFLDFFDTRHAERAYSELNGRDFFGRPLQLQYTRPSSPRFGRRAYVQQRPTPPRLQSAWRPLPAPARPPPPPSSGAGKSREGVVLLRRSTPKSSASDRSKGVNNAGRSHERKGKRGKNITIVVNATSSCQASPSESSSPASAAASASGKQQCTKAVDRSGTWRGPKSWRGRWDTRYEFKQPDADNNAATAAAATDTNTQEPETRTTVMIKNIPNKYSQKLILNMLDNHCIEYNKKIEAEGEFDDQPFSSYDFLYLPIDFNNKCNVGYGFVNLTSPEAAVRLYKAFHKQPWEVYNSRKICQVTYARLQGLEALKEHFKNSKFSCDNDEYLPVVFTPPRDGRQLTEPELLVPRTAAPSASSPRPATMAANVDPLALELMAPPSSSGDGASSTMSTHADEDVHGDGSNEDDDDDGLCRELQRLGYTD